MSSQTSAHATTDAPSVAPDDGPQDDSFATSSSHEQVADSKTTSSSGQSSKKAGRKSVVPRSPTNARGDALEVETEMEAALADEEHSSTLVDGDKLTLSGTATPPLQIGHDMPRETPRSPLRVEFGNRRTSQPARSRSASARLRESAGGIATDRRLDDLAVASSAEKLSSDDDTDEATLAAMAARYADLVKFEESLRREYFRLRRIRRRYAMFFAGLLMWCGYFVLTAFVRPSSYAYVLQLQRLCALAGLVTLALFYTSGLYTSTLVSPRKFLPHTNRALRHFHLRLVKDRLGWKTWLRRKLHFSRFFSSMRRAAIALRLRSRKRVNEESTSGSGSGASARRRKRLFHMQEFRSGRGSLLPNSTLDDIQDQEDPISYDHADIGEGVRIVMTAKAGTMAFREGWERYRQSYWAAVAEREAAALALGQPSMPNSSSRHEDAKSRGVRHQHRRDKSSTHTRSHSGLTDSETSGSTSIVHDQGGAGTGERRRSRRISNASSAASISDAMVGASKSGTRSSARLSSQGRARLSLGGSSSSSTSSLAE
ncbi:Nem1-Spo7 phosphatase regulatory subunit [Savitreella phatthalungensis]